MYECMNVRRRRVMYGKHLYIFFGEGCSILASMLYILLVVVP